MSDSSSATTPENISSNPVVPPIPASSRLIIEAIQPTIKEIRDEIEAGETKLDGHFKWLLTAFAGGFIVLGGMLVGGYLILNSALVAQSSQTNIAINSNYMDLENKFEKSQDTLIQVTTQLNDLLQRIPPVLQAIPEK